MRTRTCGGVVHVARRDRAGQGQAPAVAGEVNLGGQPAAASAERLMIRRGFRILQFVPDAAPFCGHRRRAGAHG